MLMMEYQASVRICRMSRRRAVCEEIQQAGVRVNRARNKPAEMLIPDVEYFARFSFTICAVRDEHRSALSSLGASRELHLTLFPQG